MRMSITSRTSSLAGGVLIEALSSGNCGTGRDYIPAVVLIPRFHPITQEIIALCSSLPGFTRYLVALSSSGRSVTEIARMGCITCGMRAVTKDIVSDLIPATGSFILHFVYRLYLSHSSALTVEIISASATPIGYNSGCKPAARAIKSSPMVRVFAIASSSGIWVISVPRSTTSRPNLPSCTRSIAADPYRVASIRS
jgi:hypothetical protein